jgi:hypothetical protein
VPVETVLQILGIVAWGLWAYLVLAIVLAFLAEAATRGRLRAGPALVSASGLVVPKALRRLVELAVGGVFVAASISGNLGLKAEGHQVAAVVSVDQTVPASSVKGGATEVPKKSTYRVRSGDSLWRIAERELGSGFRWREIYRLNRGRSFGNGHRLTHPHVIYSGWVLDLPRGGGKISGADRNGRDERLADRTLLRRKDRRLLRHPPRSRRSRAEARLSNLPLTLTSRRTWTERFRDDRWCAFPLAFLSPHLSHRAC